MLAYGRGVRLEQCTKKSGLAVLRARWQTGLKLTLFVTASKQSCNLIRTLQHGRSLETRLACDEIT